jgi:hypothetical protein
MYFRTWALNWRYLLRPALSKCDLRVFLGKRHMQLCVLTMRFLRIEDIHVVVSSGYA